MNARDRWSDVVHAFDAALENPRHEPDFVSIANEFLTSSERVQIIRQAIHSADRQVAVRVLEWLDESDIKELFDELLFLASWSNGLVHIARERILALPRDWVLEHVETAAERHLQEGTDDEYRRFLELYSELDLSLAQRLAARAAAHDDEHVQEAGLEFLETLRHRALRE